MHYTESTMEYILIMHAYVDSGIALAMTCCAAKAYNKGEASDKFNKHLF
jgi:hypothetical protein